MSTMTEISEHGTGERGRWIIGKDGKIDHKPKREYRPIHAVHQDTRLDPIECVCCDVPQLFDSMSAYERHVKEQGYEITGHIPKGPDSRRATEVLNELVNDETINEDWHRAQQQVDWGMKPMSSDERAEREAMRVEQEAKERAWKQRNWHKR